MTLQQWADNGWLKKHKTSRKEISNLLAIVHRDLADARDGGISEDWRFGIAYNAALKLCAMLLFAEGYRPSQNLAHYRTLQALPLIFGAERKRDADYLDTCRSKRNTAEYDYAGSVTENDADELIEFAEHLEKAVMNFLKANYPELVPGKSAEDP